MATRVLDILDTVPYETWLALNLLVTLVCLLVALRIDARTKRKEQRAVERHVAAPRVRTVSREPAAMVPEEFKTSP